MPGTTNNTLFLRGLAFVVAILLVAVLAWLTLVDEDPCANPQGDISAAVLADGEGDQDALVNRAIIIRSDCEKE